MKNRIKKNLKKLKIIFNVLILIFILIIINMFFFNLDSADFGRNIRLFFNFGLWISFFLFGIILVVFSLKSKLEKKLKVFLLLTGFSAVGFLIGVILHNFFYALAIILGDIIILKYLMEILHGIFFFVAIPISPLGFLMGIIGSIILFRKGSKKRK